MTTSISITSHLRREWVQTVMQDNLDILANETLFGDGAKHQAANAAEPVDCNFDCHIFQ